MPNGKKLTEAQRVRYYKPGAAAKVVKAKREAKTYPACQKFRANAPKYKQCVRDKYGAKGGATARPKK